MTGNSTLLCVEMHIMDKILTIEANILTFGELSDCHCDEYNLCEMINSEAIAQKVTQEEVKLC